LQIKGTATHRSGVGRARAGQASTVATKVPEIFMVVMWVCNVFNESDGRVDDLVESIAFWLRR